MAVLDSSSGRHTGNAAWGVVQESRNPVLLILFMISLIIPIQFKLAGLHLEPYRIFLLLSFVPVAVQIFSGRVGKVTAIDVFMLLYSLWIVVTLVFHHGSWGITNGGITTVELLGAYMVGRLLIRSSEDYRRFIRYFLVSLLVLAPFALHEFFTGRWIIGDYLGKVFDVPRHYSKARDGFSRVKGGFPHAIIFGLYCSIGFGNVFYLYFSNFGRMMRRIILVSLMTYTSLSSGPFLALAVQSGLIAWDKVTKGRWVLLAVLSISGYIVIDFLSNRTPVQIFVQTFTFNSTTAYWRIYIFEYGAAAALNSPIMGIGFNDWPRPFWLTSSVDNFWLLTAMRHGMVGLSFISLAIILHIASITRIRNMHPDDQGVRMGHLVTLGGLIFTLSTVHVWGSVSSLVMFYLGAGAFLYSGGRKPPLCAEPNGALQPLGNEGERIEESNTRRPSDARSMGSSSDMKRSREHEPSGASLRSVSEKYRRESEPVAKVNEGSKYSRR